MGRFQLKLKDKTRRAKGLKRKHQSAIVRCSLVDSLDVISSHKLQSLEIFRSSTVNLSVLINVLNALPSLKAVKIHFNLFTDDITGTEYFNQVQIQLQELFCGTDILHIFGCRTVKKLSIYWENSANVSAAIDFLRKQRNLEDFDLRGPSDEFFTLSEIFEFTFGLKKFKINYPLRSFPHYEALIKFLDQHKTTLISLNVDICTEPEFGIDFIHKFALENLINLKHLKFGHSKIEDGYKGDELSFIELPSATQITRNMESLGVRARSTDMNENRRFFDMFPNLKHLKFGDTDSNDIELLHCISERCVNVETLLMPKFGPEYELLATIYFPKLKEFSIHGYYEEGFVPFINRHSQTLERLTLEETDYITHLTTKEILNCPNLNYLKLHLSVPNFSVMGIFDEISCKTRPFTFILHCRWHHVWATNKFIFPDDKALWDAEIESIQNKIYERACAVQ